MAGRFAAAGLPCPPPQAAFYLYPDFEPWRERLRARHGVTTGAGLAAAAAGAVRRRGAARPARSARTRGALRLRVATGLLYGDTDAQREAALTAADPVPLPWIAAALARLEEILADLTG